jgi:small ligand-binding sensory domain FIST
MRFHSVVSDQETSAAAVEEVIEEIGSAGGGDGPPKVDVAFAFMTGHHRDDAEAVIERLWLELDPQTIVGCSAEGVIGGDKEIERQPGLAVLVAEMPLVRVHPFHIESETDWRHLLTDPQELAERVGYGPQTRAVIGFADPFTTPVGQFLKAMDEACPAAPLVGGLASSGREPGENVLFRNDQALGGGFVGLSVSGPVEVQTIVSQGCRPIGRPLVITTSHDNIIETLGGRPALNVLRETVMALTEPERQHLANGLFLGRAISEYRDTFGRGDFLVRNVIGVDDAGKSIGVADHVRTGQTVQFHVRDAATAGEDLSVLLEAQRQGPPAAGGLLFSCNGRGTRLFNVACHDIGLARQAMPQTPVAGFFAAGELGPVGGKNFIHGHTASFALFRPE